MNEDETENKVDGPCTENDGCPTEIAVLKREWRRLKKLEEELEQTRQMRNQVQHVATGLTGI